MTTNNSTIVGGSANTNYSGTYQRYGEYTLQYTDYNGNADADGSVPGDEDGTGSIV